ncbi:NUDIX domain-containing protein [Thalassospira sp. UBA4513]|uniref:NUDIX domain-containing protein n=1 Tax=Thalassospira sp. UBA4513 TaxID=1947675 RepID=UPI00257E997D|nr:NUDIX domain-containing protein [Thalassospira sp. UBA4513]|tara:strand:+ start:922 stop:1539 length:618 start_codon:yes stop_codon:yes gene_type:complete
MMFDLPKGWSLPDQDHVRVSDIDCLSDNWYRLYRVSFDLKRSDGSWQSQTREAYERGNGAGILLYNRADRTVVLTRQFRLPSFVNGNEDGMLIEVPAGVLDDRDPASAVIAEVEEETGYKIGKPRQVFDLFMSPGSVTERLHLFIAEVTRDHREGDGGGLHEEGEDIHVLEIGFDDIIPMMADGRIRDAKTVILLQHALLTKLFD